YELPNSVVPNALLSAARRDRQTAVHADRPARLVKLNLAEEEPARNGVRSLGEDEVVGQRYADAETVAEARRGEDAAVAAAGDVVASAPVATEIRQDAQQLHADSAAAGADDVRLARAHAGDQTCCVD